MKKYIPNIDSPMPGYRQKAIIWFEQQLMTVYDLSDLSQASVEVLQLYF